MSRYFPSIRIMWNPYIVNTETSAANSRDPSLKGTRPQKSIKRRQFGPKTADMQEDQRGPKCGLSKNIPFAGGH